MKTKIKNRKDQNIVVQLKNENGKSGLVFIAHGLSGNKEQIHIQAYAETFLKNDYVVLLWDSTNTLGESDGDLKYATLTGYYKDMEDVIKWSESQSWYKEKFIVAGHSLGGACDIFYANDYPNKVKALAPTSAFLSGSVYLDSLGDGVVRSWKEKGYREQESESKPGLIKRYDWELAEDLLKYELFDQAKTIKVPTLLIVGSEDDGTPLSTQQKFYDNLPTDKKELHIISGAGHTFFEKNHLTEIKGIINKWIKKIS